MEDDVKFTRPKSWIKIHEFKWNWMMVMVILYMYSKKTSTINEYHVFRDLFLHFLYKSEVKTTLDYWKGFFPIFWISKNSCTRLSLTWSYSINMHIKQNIMNKTWHLGIPMELRLKEIWKSWQLNNSITLLIVSSKVESTQMCKDASSGCTQVMNGIHG
jgi:hypothetical protein